MRRELDFERRGRRLVRSTCSRRSASPRELDGKLSVDGAKLDAAFTADFDAVGELFADRERRRRGASSTSCSSRISQTDGVFDSRNDGLKSSIDDIDDRREALNNRLDALCRRATRKQFNALDSLLAQLQSTSNFLTQQLEPLPGSAPLRRNELTGGMDHELLD